MRCFAVTLVLGLVAGCASAPPPRPIAPEAPEAGDPIVVEANEDVPRSIRRLVAEQRDEVASIRALASDLRDVRGRARARREAEDLAEELEAIEAEVLSSMADSERLDAVVVRLHRLETKTALIHDALRQASL